MTHKRFQPIKLVSVGICELIVITSVRQSWRFNRYAVAIWARATIVADNHLTDSTASGHISVDYVPNWSDAISRDR